MSTELTYEDENGNSVHTSQYLTNRKSCCKTFCLHCPYGTTLKKFGLTFEPITNDPSSLSEANSILIENEGVDTLGSSLIASAFGDKKKVRVSKFNYENFVKFTLKGILCGVMRVKNDEGKEIFLKKHFKNQGLELDLVSALFSESK